MPIPAADALIPEGLLLALALGLVGVVHWFERGAQSAPTDVRFRRRLLVAGAALLVVAFAPPLDTLASTRLLTAHLIQVTLVMGFAPPLLLLGLPRQSGRRVAAWVCRLGRTVTHPVLAIALVNVVFFGWHAAGPYEASLRHPALYALQQATFLAISLAFWWPIVGPRASSRPVMSPYQKLGYILLATIPQTFAGMTLALARHPLYAAYDTGARTWGFDVMTDQQVAGACMALVSKVALFVAFSVVFVRLLSDGGSEDTDDGGGGGRRGDDAPVPAPGTAAGPVPEWLGLVEMGETVEEPTPSRPREAVPSS